MRTPVGSISAIALGPGLPLLLSLGLGLGTAACSGASLPSISGEAISGDAPDASTATSTGTSTGATGTGVGSTNPIFATTDGGSAASSSGGSSGSSSSGSTGSGGSAGDDASTGTSGSGSGTVSSGATYGNVVDGVYNYGPVQWTGSFNNACSPYTASDEATIGTMLAGLSNFYNADASLCDACVKITTGLGKTVVAHVVTYGVTVHDGDIDLSPDAYNAIYEADPAGTTDYPRPMSWQLISCPVTGDLSYDFQTASSEYWTSFWVRNPRLAITKVEVQSTNHPTWFALRRETDSTYNCDDGVGAGAWDVRVTAEDGSTVTDHFTSVPAGQEVVGTGQF